jgi:hypothetical protein
MIQNKIGQSGKATLTKLHQDLKVGSMTFSDWERAIITEKRTEQIVLNLPGMFEDVEIEEEKIRKG